MRHKCCKTVHTQYTESSSGGNSLAESLRLQKMMKIGLALSTANHGNFFWEGLKQAKHITYWCGVVDSLVALIKTAESLGMSTSLNEELGKKTI